MVENPAVEPYFGSYRSIEGWFQGTDFLLFEKIDRLQRELGHAGDVLEVGAFHGQSAILLGYFLQRGESLVVCDTFPGQRDRGLPASHRHVFERNFRRFHSELPTIIEGFSAEVLGDLHAGAFRFIHVDGSHRYEDVLADLAHAKRLLAPGGVVAFDDFRWVTVGAALWEEIVLGELTPFCFSTWKMYATFGKAVGFAEQLATWADEDPALLHTDRAIFDYHAPEISLVPSRLVEAGMGMLGRLRRFFP